MRSIFKSLFVVSVILFCGFAGVVSADGDPVVIPGDAVLITTDGQPVSESIDPGGDEDWFEFTLSNAALVVIATEAGSVYDPDDDTVLWLYDAAGYELGYNDDVAEGVLFSRIDTALPAGTYYIRISEYNAKRILVDYSVYVLAGGEPDIVADGIVNLDDFSFMSAHWGQVDPDAADLNWDGAVDVTDLRLLAVHWLEERLPEGLIEIPAGDSVESFSIGKFEVTNREYRIYLNDALAKNLIEVESGVVYAQDDDDESFPYCATSDAGGSDIDSQIEYADGAFSVLEKNGSDMSDHPMVAVSWYGGAAYCNWLSERQAGLGLEPCYDLSTWACDMGKNGYRLPTEAEWEHAARGGSEGFDYPWGSDLIDPNQANYAGSDDPYEGSSYPRTTPVGFYNGELHAKADFGWPGAEETYLTSDASNGYGLYDISGNVFEWCNDWREVDDTRVLRGGSWFYNSNLSRIGYLGAWDPEGLLNSYGFRVVLIRD